MGLHADAIAMAKITGKPVAECKKARKAHDAQIGKLSNRTPEAMAQVCFGPVVVAVGKATSKPVKVTTPPAVEKAIDPKPDEQVQPVGQVEKGIIETHDSDTIPVTQKDEAAEKKKSKDSKLKKGL